MRPSSAVWRFFGWLFIFAGIAFTWLLIALAIGYGIKASKG